MKSSLKKSLLSVPALAILFFIIVLLTSCPGARPGPAQSPALASYPLTLVFKIDTSGNQTNPHLMANGTIPTGSQVILVCTSRDCVQSASANGGSNTGAKIFFSGTLTQDIPANTELTLQIVSKDNPVNISGAAIPK